MLICKVCGAANASNAAVCSDCGASLLRKEKETHSNEIFSSKNTDNKVSKSADFNEIYSSRSGYDEAQQKKIFEKIRKQEEALGDTVKNSKPTIKDSTPSAVPGNPKNVNGGYKSRPSSSKNHKIPQRIIESVDKQMIQQKMKPSSKSMSDDDSENGKVELTSSKVIEEIHEKHQHTLQMRRLAEQEKQGKTKGVAVKESQRKKDKAFEKEQNERLKQLEKQRKFEEKQSIKADIKEEKTAKRSSGSPDSKKSVLSSSCHSEVFKERSVLSDANYAVKNRTQQKKVSNKTITNTYNSSSVEKISTGKETSAVKNSGENKVNSNVAKKSVNKNEDFSVNSAKFSDKIRKQPNKTISSKPSDTANKLKQQTASGIKSNGNNVKSANSINSKPDKKSINKNTADKLSVKQSTSVNQIKNIKNSHTDAVKIKEASDSAKPVKKLTKEVSEISGQKNSLEKGTAAQEKSVSSDTKRKTKNAKHSKVKKEKNIKTKTLNKKNSISYDFSDEDVANNKYIAALSYIGILFVFPFARKNRSEFCKAHVRQGTILFLFSIIFLIVTLAAVIGLRYLLVWFLGLPYIIYSILYYLIILAAAVLIFIPVFKGTEGAINGTYSDVPFIGKIAKK